MRPATWRTWRDRVVIRHDSMSHPAHPVHRCYLFTWIFRIDRIRSRGPTDRSIDVLSPRPCARRREGHRYIVSGSLGVSMSHPAHPVHRCFSSTWIDRIFRIERRGPTDPGHQCLNPWPCARQRGGHERHRFVIHRRFDASSCSSCLSMFTWIFRMWSGAGDPEASVFLLLPCSASRNATQVEARGGRPAGEPGSIRC